VISLTLTKWRKTMKRSASEIIRNLQMRIARLERQATSNKTAWEADSRYADILNNLYESVVDQEILKVKYLLEDLLKELKRNKDTSTRIRATEKVLSEINRKAESFKDIMLSSNSTIESFTGDKMWQS
jgi:DNA-binding transcriptional regulator GbsR (MarR family)